MGIVVIYFKIILFSFLAGVDLGNFWVLMKDLFYRECTRF